MISRRALCFCIGLVLAPGVQPGYADAQPPMSGPLSANPDPLTFRIGSMDPITVSGAFSGIAFVQDKPSPGDRHARADIDNAEFFIQSSSGWLQFFVQTGVYSLSSLGTSYLSAGRTPEKTYGCVPQAFFKLAPTDEISIEAGKLPSLIGDESTFSFQNGNIERGLLWNQTSSVSRGVQVNYVSAPVTLSISWNDGYYSNRFNWLTGLGTCDLGAGFGAVTVMAGVNLGHTGYSSFATPLAQNNSAVVDISYTIALGSWTFNPYVQFSKIPMSRAAGLANSSHTAGAAALVTRKLTDEWAIVARAEYISTDGGLNLLYGADSAAASITLTPSYQKGVFFARAEASYVLATHLEIGSGLGCDGGSNSQARLMLETGLLL